MKRALAMLGLCLAASCVLPDVPIIDSLGDDTTGGGPGSGGMGSGGTGGSNAASCPAQRPTIVDTCMDVSAGTVCHWFPVSCTCQASLVWVCTGCEQGAPCAVADQACSGADGQCVCQMDKWSCSGAASGGTGNGGSGGSTGGMMGGSGGAAGSAGASGSGSGGGGVRPECVEYCSGPDGILARCPGEIPEWPDENLCADGCDAHGDSVLCWLTHLGYILDGGDAAMHCPHATGAPTNGICDER